MEEQNMPSVPSEQVQPMSAEVKSDWKSFIGKNFLGLSIIIAGVLISGSIFYNNGIKAGSGTAQIQQPQLPSAVVKDVSVDNDPVLGKSNAKVTIIEFSDYQCPFCRIWWKESFNKLKSEYIDTGKVKLVYRDYPLAFHPMSHSTAEAAECSKEQDKYWEMHDKIFSEEEKLGQGTVTYTVQDLKKWAGEIGLNQAQFNQCLDSGKNKAEVDKDLADGTASGVNGTPSFFINGRLLVGAQPYAAFKAVIDEELKK